MTERLSTRRYLRLLLILFVLAPLPATCADISYQNVLDWLQSQADAPTDGLAPGVYSSDRLADFAAYLAPGYIDNFNFPELNLEIEPTVVYRAHPVYEQATAQHGSSSTLAADGNLENYQAGQPFAAEAIRAATPEQAGYMVAWNQIHRWQNYGYRNESQILFVKPTADGKPGSVVEGMEGGGSVDRSLTMFYHRVYLSKLSQLPDSDYRMAVDDSDELLFKEYIEMLAPHDIAGLKMVIERPLRQADGDQVNSYLPAERRVRRLSAKERADSWVGTHWTLDDFEGFSGMVMDNTWRFIGEKVVPSVANSRNPIAHYHGPSSTVPLDRWQLRRCWVVESVPRWEGHPYGRRLMFVDQETYNIPLVLVFDRDNQLMKHFTMVYEHSPVDAELPLAESTPRWRSSIVVSMKDGTANIAQGTKTTEFVEVEPSFVRKLFSVSSLTSGR